MHYIPPDGDPIPLSLELFHDLVRSLELDSPPHLFVHDHFDVARSLLLYSWFESSFYRPAELQAFATLELALRFRLCGSQTLRDHGPGMRRLLRQAVAHELLRDQDLRPYPRITGFGRAWSREYGTRVPDPDTDRTHTVRNYVEVLCEAIPDVRNRLAHGEPGWVPTAFATLSTCRDLINRLAPFQPDGGGGAAAT